MNRCVYECMRIYSCMRLLARTGSRENGLTPTPNILLLVLDRSGRPHKLGLPIVVCVERLPADKPWDVVVSVTRRSSGVAPRACVNVYAHVLVPPNLYTLHTYIHRSGLGLGFSKLPRRPPLRPSTRSLHTSPHAAQNILLNSSRSRWSVHRLPRRPPKTASDMPPTPPQTQNILLDSSRSGWAVRW